MHRCHLNRRSRSLHYSDVAAKYPLSWYPEQRPKYLSVVQGDISLTAPLLFSQVLVKEWAESYMKRSSRCWHSQTPPLAYFYILQRMLFAMILTPLHQNCHQIFLWEKQFSI